MNKEQQQIIDKAYEDYLDITDKKWMNSDIGDLDDMIYDGYLFVDGDDIRVLKREEFIYIIKEVAEFSEKCGLKIEGRELSEEERWRIRFDYYPKDKQFPWDRMALPSHRFLDDFNIPRRTITITYNNETIESYE